MVKKQVRLHLNLSMVKQSVPLPHLTMQPLPPRHNAAQPCACVHPSVRGPALCPSSVCPSAAQPCPSTGKAHSGSTPSPSMWSCQLYLHPSTMLPLALSFIPTRCSHQHHPFYSLNCNKIPLVRKVSNSTCVSHTDWLNHLESCTTISLGILYCILGGQSILNTPFMLEWDNRCAVPPLADESSFSPLQCVTWHLLKWTLYIIQWQAWPLSAEVFHPSGGAHEKLLAAYSW